MVKSNFLKLIYGAQICVVCIVNATKIYMLAYIVAYYPNGS